MNDNRCSTSLTEHRSRRQRWLASRSSAAIVGIATAVALATASVVAGAGIDQSASVSAVADRLTDPTALAFPINPTPRCLVLNNYGGYSKYKGGYGHQGVDIGADQYQEVYAVEAGTLYRQWTDLNDAPGLGWGLWSNTDTKYRYFHLADFAPDLAVGDYVQKGQLIGYVGDTGNASKGGWHLHFEVHPGPAPHKATVDPVPLLPVPPSCTVY